MWRRDRRILALCGNTKGSDQKKKHDSIMFHPYWKNSGCQIRIQDMNQNHICHVIGRVGSYPTCFSHFPTPCGFSSWATRGECSKAGTQTKSRSAEQPWSSRRSCCPCSSTSAGIPLIILICYTKIGLEMKLDHKGRYLAELSWICLCKLD